jgi:negative regulator of sigma-B (phosphoserine phosphatase)
LNLLIDHRSRPKVGESQCGDSVLVRTDGDRTFVAVIDALGHGPHAALTAKVAIDHLQTSRLDQGVGAIMEALHAAMQGTRGAAALLGLFHADQLEGCSVGNVDLRAIGVRIPVVLSPGVVGGTVRKVRVFRATIHSGARLAIFSDGISSRVALEESKHLAPKDACTTILEKYSRRDDDSTIVIVDIGTNR